MAKNETRIKMDEDVKKAFKNSTALMEELSASMNIEIDRNDNLGNRMNALEKQIYSQTKEIQELRGSIYVSDICIQELTDRIEGLKQNGLRGAKAGKVLGEKLKSREAIDDFMWDLLEKKDTVNQIVAPRPAMDVELSIEQRPFESEGVSFGWAKTNCGPCVLEIAKGEENLFVFRADSLIWTEYPFQEYLRKYLGPVSTRSGLVSIVNNEAKLSYTLPPEQAENSECGWQDLNNKERKESGSLYEESMKDFLLFGHDEALTNNKEVFDNIEKTLKNPLDMSTAWAFVLAKG